MAARTADDKLIIDVDEEITGVANEESTGVTDKNIGVATSDKG